MSAIIAGLIPKIEGFQPIPNAVMIPFMEAQSAALAFGFGLNYEYGKRKIRSMSNDEFNSLTSEDITNMSNAHTHIILSKFQAQVPAVMPMQQEIFKQYVIIEKAKVIQNFELAKWMVRFVKETVDDTTAHLLGGHLHGEILEPYITDPNKFINPITGEQGAEATTPPPPTTSPYTVTTPPPEPYEHLEDARKPEALAWLEKRDDHINNFFRLKKKYYDPTFRSSASTTTLREIREAANARISSLTTLSNDYRNPNDFIRTQAILLRQLLATEQFKRIPYS